MYFVLIEVIEHELLQNAVKEGKLTRDIWTEQYLKLLS
jgi:hypothetical protein